VTGPARRVPIAGLTLFGLAAAAAARFGFGSPMTGSRILFVTLVLCGTPLVFATARGLLRGRFAADVVAALAIITAVMLGQYFAGAIIVLMQAGGEALDAFALRRASQSLEALLARAPRIARRRRGGVIDDIAAGEVRPDDELVLRPGDMVPVDCVVLEGHSSIDASALTGEPEPRPAAPGTMLLSGSINQEGALAARALRPADQSQYHQIIRLVEQARAEKAPIQRLADRYAVWFTPLTLAMCLVAWLVSHDAVSVLAVLVVATPCPLILATPVAVIAGIGRAARRGIIVRHGGAIEEVGRAEIVVFDKTGTLTLGRPAVDDVVAYAGWSTIEVLRLAAAVETLSSHHLGQAIAEEGRRLLGALPLVSDFRESAGAGVEGRIGDARVRVGSARWVGCADDAAASSNESRAWVCVDGRSVGHIRFADRLRENVPALITTLRQLGIRDIVMLTGDREPAAKAIASLAGIASVFAELLPEGKVARLRALRRDQARVLMVGDGINDAPALAAASVGIAMGAHAPAAAAQAADIVVLVDDIGRVAEAITIGRRTRRIAMQSIGVGLGVSGTLMIIAAFGHIAPAAGALLQEALDVAVILNALRARLEPRRLPHRQASLQPFVVAGVSKEHTHSEAA
jgi:heavy metal translocating P-type ATPase